MANYGTTTRLALRKLLGTSKVREIAIGIGALADDVDALLPPFSAGGLLHQAKAQGDPFQSFASGVLTVVNFASEPYDVGGLVNIGTQATRVTFQRNGVYVVTAKGDLGASTDRLQILDSAGSVIGGSSGPIAGSTTMVATIHQRFAAGDYVRLQLRQSSGGPMTPNFSDLWVAQVQPY